MSPEPITPSWIAANLLILGFGAAVYIALALALKYWRKG